MKPKSPMWRYTVDYFGVNLQFGLRQLTLSSELCVHIIDLLPEGPRRLDTFDFESNGMLAPV